MIHHLVTTEDSGDFWEGKCLLRRGGGTYGDTGCLRGGRRELSKRKTGRIGRGVSITERS